jgi:hypothetical protein
MLDINILNEIKTLIGDGITCPADIQGLNKVIELKNKLTKQLNNLYTQINSISKFIDPLPPAIDTTKVIIKVTQTAIDVLSNIPSTTYTPIPVGPILIGQKVINKLNTLIGKTEGQISTAESYLSTVKSELQKVLDLLSMVDLFIGLCSEELGNPTINQISISQELLNSTQNQSNQLSPVVTNVNGFEMSVRTVDGDTDQDLKRRQAIARNKAGIIMLQGDHSFSSNDQILIDELVFYIQQNNLKAD